ncbi:MAG: metal ABC transporter substrate-binding protein [Halobacteriota archaeon]
MRSTRRRVLRGTGAVSAALLAGCLGNGSDGSSAGTNGELEAPAGRGGYAAFFTLADWTQHVAGDHMDVVNPVPAGEVGHGWEPTADLQTQVAESDVFVYLDIPEFRWAQKLVESIDGEDADVVTIDALEGLDIRDHEEDDHEEDDHEEDDHEEDDHEEDDHEEDDHEEDDHEEDDHDHGTYDPHVWVDPVLAQSCVETIADGLAEADPDNAAAYHENAEAYVSELQSLHETIEATLSNRNNDTLVFAGHDSFQYLSARYDFDIHSPQGVSPQDEATTAEIIDTIDLVNGRGVQYVAYDVFDSDTLAQQIVAESDAEEVVAMTPAEGTTPEWNENGWGYIEQMEEINLPALESALDAY